MEKPIQPAENTVARVFVLRKRRRELLDQFYKLGDRSLKLLEVSRRYTAAGIRVFGVPSPVRDWNREQDITERVHAKAKYLSEERKRLLPVIGAIEAELDALPFVPDEEDEEFD